MSKDLLLISLFGPSGSGKGYVGNVMHDHLSHMGWSVSRVEVAQPLHAIQHFAYSLFGLDSTGQDGQLLEFMAGHFEAHLGPLFQHHVEHAQAEYPRPLAILNSDCRNNAYLLLKSLGFTFIEVLASPEVRAKRLIQRHDLSAFDSFNPVNQTHAIQPHLSITDPAQVPDTLSRIIDG